MDIWQLFTGHTGLCLRVATTHLPPRKVKQMQMKTEFGFRQTATTANAIPESPSIAKLIGQTTMTRKISPSGIFSFPHGRFVASLLINCTTYNAVVVVVDHVWKEPAGVTRAELSSTFYFYG